MNILLLVGRIMFGAYFAMMGMMHFAKMGTMVRFSESKKIPMPKVSVIITGLLLLLGGLGIITGSFVSIALLMLVMFLIPVSFLIHQFWKAETPQDRMVEMQSFLKNMALLGGILILYTLYTANWAYALNTTI